MLVQRKPISSHESGNSIVNYYFRVIINDRAFLNDRVTGSYSERDIINTFKLIVEV
jgi:hypothetical protein